MKINDKLTWKTNNKKYLCSIQKFLDKASNIENPDLRNEIIYQMLECDKILTDLILKEAYKLQAHK